MWLAVEVTCVVMFTADLCVRGAGAAVGKVRPAPRVISVPSPHAFPCSPSAGLGARHLGLDVNAILSS
jgi:hypothetical protein